jgi:hypothetical protein
VHTRAHTLALSLHNKQQFSCWYEGYTCSQLDPLSVLYVAIFIKIIPVLQLIISKAAQSVQRLEDWRYNAHAKLHFALWQIFVPSVLLDKWSFIKNCFDKWLFLKARPCKKYQFWLWRIVGTHTLTVSYLYLVFTDSTAIVGKKGRFQNVNPRQPQKAGNPKPQNPKP